MWLALIRLQHYQPQLVFLQSFCLALLAEVTQETEALTDFVSMAVLEEGRHFFVAYEMEKRHILHSKSFGATHCFQCIPPVSFWLYV